MNPNQTQLELELNAAELEVERIKDTYKDEEDLLNLYLPSAEHLVITYKKLLAENKKNA